MSFCSSPLSCCCWALRLSSWVPRPALRAQGLPGQVLTAGRHGLPGLLLQLGLGALQLGDLHLDALPGGGHVGQAPADLLDHLQLALVAVVERLPGVFGLVEHLRRLGPEDVGETLHQSHKRRTLDRKLRPCRPPPPPPPRPPGDAPHSRPDHRCPPPRPALRRRPRPSPPWAPPRRLARPARPEARGPGHGGQVEAVGGPEEGLEIGSGDRRRRAWGRKEKIPPPSLSTTTNVASMPRRAAPSRPPASWRKVRSPQRATTGRLAGRRRRPRPARWTRTRRCR